LTRNFSLQFSTPFLNMAKVSQVPADMAGFVIGIIGMGDMGKMYTRRLSAAGWR